MNIKKELGKENEGLLQVCKHTKMLAEREGKTVFIFLLSRLLETLSLTIPGFIIVLLFPIDSFEPYGWLSGVWHGWFALCNMAIHYFVPTTLYLAPNGTSSYYVSWWIFNIWGLLALLGFFYMNVFEVRERKSRVENKLDINNRIIKVFISSTFNDMQKERDYLMAYIFPKLKEKAMECNVELIPIDLRWGVTEEESRSGKVMELCLQEIDNSIPFFIGIIGDRYGWQPSIEDFSKSKVLSERYPWVKDDIERGLSVTEMEIQYGVLRRSEAVNAIFFCKGGTADAALIEGNSNNERIAHLKWKIINDGRYPMFSVYSVEDIGQKVFDVYTKYLDLYFSEQSQLISNEDESCLEMDISVRSFIVNYLKKYGKKISDSQMEKILNHPMANNRVVIKSLLDELLLFGKFEELDTYLAYLLTSQEPKELYVKILERFERQYGNKQVRSFFAVLRLANKGLFVKELLKVIDVNTEYELFHPEFSIMGFVSFFSSLISAMCSHRYVPFDKYFSEYLQREETGKIRLSHPYMEQAIDDRYLDTEKNISKYKKILEQYNESAENM